MRPRGTIAIIWDISKVGAKLTINIQDEIPDEFTLVLSARAAEGRTCRVVWRSKQQIGIQFLKGSKPVMAAEAETAAADQAQLDC